MGGYIFAKDHPSRQGSLNEEIDWASIEDVDDAYDAAHGLSIYDDLGIEANFGTYPVSTQTLSRLIARMEQIMGDIDEQDSGEQVLAFLKSCRDHCLNRKISQVYMTSTD
ncbi:MAG: hypothetical protein GYA24_11830 [Candidatus Lokiarchaeota archaeon]|nr:hypothetical protein [Candidatus Lokiarchaeota archaeon]